MRLFNTLFIILLLSGLAAAQVTVMGGTASNWVPPYGVYAAPFVPLVTTPSVTLATVSPSAAGASNATFGNVAGATNATLSMYSQPPAGAYTQAIWSPPYTQPTWVGPSVGPEPPAEPMGEGRPSHRARAFDVGVCEEAAPDKLDSHYVEVVGLDFRPDRPIFVVIAQRLGAAFDPEGIF